MEAERWSFLGLAPEHKKKKNETNQISPKQFKSNGLRLVSTTAGGRLSDRLTGDMRGPRAKSRPGPEEQQQGNNDLCRQRRTEQWNNGSNENNQTKPIFHNPIKYSNLHCCGKVRRGTGAMIRST